MALVRFAMSIETVPLHNQVDYVCGRQKIQDGIDVLRPSSTHLNVNVGDTAPELLVPLNQVYDADQTGSKSLGDVVVWFLGALARGGGVRQHEHEDAFGTHKASGTARNDTSAEQIALPSRSHFH